MSTTMLQNEEIVENSTARKINKLLNSSETRVEGLRLLSLFLPQSSYEDFLQFGISWMQNCCKTDGLTKNRDYAIHLLSDLFKASSNYQELKKSVSFFITTRYFDYFFKHLLNSSAGWSCTQSCLLFYRGACGPFQVALEKHLRSELEKNVKISSVVGGCFALMPSVGGAGREVGNYVKNWKIQFVNFLNACHSILNDLFVNVEEFQEYEVPKETWNHNKKERSSEYLTIQLKNHLIVLNCMLLTQFPAAKNVPSEPVFQLICRGLALNSKVLTKQKTISEKVLSEIQCAFLTFLKALIVTCKTQLLPYSHLICKLIKQVLERTGSGCAHERGSSSSGLRILAYEALCNWLAVARSGSCVEAISTVLISNAVNDFRSTKKVVFLKERKLQKRLKNKEQIILGVNGTASSRLCITCLKALQFLLKFSGVLLKPEEHKFLQEILIKLIKEVQKNLLSDVPVPFGISACRLELYSLLLELICQPCPKWPPSTNYALRLFREGMNDPSSKVSTLCSGAVNFATVIIHPQFDNGGFSPNETPDGRSRTEVELQRDEELMEINNREEDEISQEKSAEVEDDFESDKRETVEKSKDMSEESVISSDEDSRNTVKFLQDSAEPVVKNISIDETKEEESLAQTCRVNDEPYSKKQRISTEEITPERTFSSVTEKLDESSSVNGSPENGKMKKSSESTNPEEIISSKSESPVSVNEDGVPKARYYLRSKAKGSSEEPEETAKRTISPEALKNTPTKNQLKNTPNVPSATKRPRTRALSKIETSSETEVKTVVRSNREDVDVDEEDIKAAFNDSFVD